MASSADPEPPPGAGRTPTGSSSSLASYSLSNSTAAAAALLGLVLSFYAVAPLWHTDVWAHLRFARWIVEHGSSPGREPFCEFSDPDIPLINFPWLAQLATLAAFRTGEALAGGDEVRRLAGGVAGLRALSLLLAAACSVFLLAAFRRATGSLLAGALGLLAYNILAPTALGVLRPQLFGMALFAYFLWVLASPRIGWAGVLALTLASALWANLHGSFVMGLALIGAHLGGRLLEACRGEGRWGLGAAFTDGRAGLLLAGLVGACLGAMINPSGPWLYQHVLTFGRNPAVRTFDEFQPLFNLSVGPLALWLFLAGWVLLFASWLTARRGPSATGVLLILLFGVLPVWQRRLMIWWMPLVPLLAAPAWAALLKRRWGDAELPGGPNLRNTAVAGLALLFALALSPPVAWLSRGPAPLATAVTRETPWELALVVDGVGVPGDRAGRLREGISGAFDGGPFRGRIFASETAAELFVWRGGAPSPVIVYTHIHLFNMAHWEMCLEVKSGGAGWDTILDGWGVNLIVVEAATHPGLCLAASRHGAWRVLEGRPGRIGGPSEPLFVAVRKKPL